MNPAGKGTKVAAHYILKVPAGGSVVVRARLYQYDQIPDKTFGEDFDNIFSKRQTEADMFYKQVDSLYHMINFIDLKKMFGSSLLYKASVKQICLYVKILLNHT